MSWGTPNISSDKWAGKSIAGYDVSWDGGPLPRFAHVSGNSCSIHVDDAYRALSYEVTVKTVFQGGSSGGFASDSGFAISTQDLIWRDGGSNCSPAAAEQWYVTMLQKGFTYSFDFKTGSGVVEFYTYKTLDSLHSLTSPAHVQSWTCDEEGQGHKFYVRVASSPSSAPFTFVASYGF